MFLSRYVINSKLYKEGEISKVDLSQMGDEERRTRDIMRDVEGGAYNKQMVGGLFLEA